MPKFLLTYDVRLIYKTSYEWREFFLGKIHLQNCKIIWDSVRKLAPLMFTVYWVKKALLMCRRMRVLLDLSRGEEVW